MSQAKPVSTSEHVAIVGLTGGIASGKSTVTKMFRQLGATVIDADVVAREVVEPGTPALAEIVEAFGSGVLQEDGSLDRPALGAIVFTDDGARKRLGAITHPRIAMRMMEHAESARLAGNAWVIYDAALLVENRIHEMLPALIVVTCDRDTQIERLMARDGFSEEEALSRIESQLPLSDKVAVADHIIDNAGSLGETKAQVEQVFRSLVQTYGPVAPNPAESV